MARLIGLLALYVLAAGAQQEPAAPPESAAAQQQRRAWARLERAAAAESLEQRQELFALLVALERAPADAIAHYWDRLAAAGGDAEQADRILYYRKRALPLPEPAPHEGPSALLERALAAWGEGRLVAARLLLESGETHYGGNPVFRQNLDWLLWRIPDPIDPRAGARMSALAVLAARRARS